MATHADPHGHGHADHAPHRPISFYIAIAVFLTILTTVEVGPLFGLYRLPPEVLILLSAVKFFTVVAFFMHLWDDAAVFTRLFAAPLIGATAMVTVLMLLHHTFAPSPKIDPLTIQERYRENWNEPCSSWIRSHRSNRWYCASPAIDNAQLALHLEKPKSAFEGGGPAVDLASMSEADRTKWLMTRGGELYSQNCQACHQATGDGLPGAFPPLHNSDFLGDAKNHAKIVVHGLSGAITVNGQTFNGNMPAQGATYGDTDLAAILTYERMSWGNNFGVVMPEDVKAVR